MSTATSGQVREILKCGKDPVYFIKQYAKIQHPVRGTIAFKTFPYQDDCVEAFQQHRLNIILKSRQLGLSTICAAYAVWLAIFAKDKNILVIATKLATAKNFIRKCTVVLNNLPKWLLLPTYDPSLQAISFNNGSQIKAIPTSSDAGRSEALSLLIIDEAAHIRDFDDIWTGLSPTFSTGGRAIVLSTPNGVGGQYYKLWVEAESGANGFNPIRILWHQHPEHDQKWFDNETRSLSKRSVSQEFLCDFVASGDTFLQPDELESLRNLIRPPAERAGDRREIWIWADPVPGRQYVISADVSRGDAHDFSAFHIIDVEEREVAVEYVGKLPPERLADLISEWGNKYNVALAAPENNTFGYFVNVKLRDSGYKRLYYHGVSADPFGYVSADMDELPGFPTNGKTRVQILAKLNDLVRNKALKTYSQRLYDQFQAFVWNGSKPQAAKDGFDDLIMSLAIGCWLIEGGSAHTVQQQAMAYAMLQATGVRRNTNASLNIDVVIPPMQVAVGVGGQAVQAARNRERMLRTAYGGRYDISWLYR